jgi:uncharacterized SAM-binding protein YcdF (DUF218 family)
MNKLLFIVKRLFVLVLIAIMLQAVYFFIVLKTENKTIPSEAIVIFTGGGEKRIQAGYALADQGVAPLIILSSATNPVRKAYDRKYGRPQGVRHIREPQARTTLENAYFVSRLIEEHQLKSITLVTADYHMPRSLLWMRWFLAGKGVQINIYKVYADREDKRVEFRSAMARLLYNEMIKSWGSLAEYIVWLVPGSYFERKDGNNQSDSVLRRLFLMEEEITW